MCVHKRRRSSLTENLEIKMSTNHLIFITSLLILLSGTSGMIVKNTELTYGENNETCVSEYSCVDCKTPRVCRKFYNGTYEKVAQFQCGKDTPFCDPDSGTCSQTTHDPTCQPEAPEFRCSADGNYPDPLSCYKYYTCIKGVAYKTNCGTSIYNIKSENCKYGTICYTVDCSHKSGIKVPHPGSKSFYGYCYNSTLILFDKCPGQFVLNTDKQICEAVCNEEGYQGDPYDCSRYYKCSHETSSSSLTLTKLQCPEDELYDSVNQHCAPKKEGLVCASGLTYIGNGEFEQKINF